MSRSKMDTRDADNQYSTSVVFVQHAFRSIASCKHRHFLPGSTDNQADGRSKRRQLPAAATDAEPMAPDTAIPEAAGPAATTEADHAPASAASGSNIAPKAVVETTKKTLGSSTTFVLLGARLLSKCDEHWCHMSARRFVS